MTSTSKHSTGGYPGAVSVAVVDYDVTLTRLTLTTTSKFQSLKSSKFSQYRKLLICLKGPYSQLCPSILGSGATQIGKKESHWIFSLIYDLSVFFMTVWTTQTNGIWPFQLWSDYFHMWPFWSDESDENSCNFYVTRFVIRLENATYTLIQH